MQLPVRANKKKLLVLSDVGGDKATRVLKLLVDKEGTSVKLRLIVFSLVFGVQRKTRSVISFTFFGISIGNQIYT